MHHELISSKVMYIKILITFFVSNFLMIERYVEQLKLYSIHVTSKLQKPSAEIKLYHGYLELFICRWVRTLY